MQQFLSKFPTLFETLLLIIFFKFWWKSADNMLNWARLRLGQLILNPYRSSLSNVRKLNLCQCSTQS